MPAVLIRLRVNITHPRSGGERFVAALPGDRVRHLVARLLVEAGIEDDPRTWELLDGKLAFPADSTVGKLLAQRPPKESLTLRRIKGGPVVHRPPTETITLPTSAPGTDFTDILIAKQIISPDQLEVSRQLANSSGIKLQDALVKFNYATPQEVMAAVAEQYGLQFVDLTAVEIPKAVIELIPESVARENVVLPLSLEGNTLRIVTADPANLDTLQKLQFILNKDIVPVLAVQEQIQEAIDRYYGQTETESVDSMLVEFTDTAIEFTQTAGPPDTGVLETDFEVPPTDDSGSEAVALDDDSDVADEFEDEEPDENLDDVDSGEFDLKITPGAAAAPAAAGELRGVGAAVRSETATRFKKSARGRAETRRATVRYYSRMNPDRVFPLLVMLTREEVEKIVKRHVEQKATGPLKIDADVPLEIEPVLPGCVCHPPRVTTKVGGGDETFVFHVVPHVLGKVTGARVLIRQDHRPLAEIELDVKVVQRTMVLVSGLSAFALPAASAVMNHFGLDFTPKAGGSAYLAALNFLFQQVSPALLTAVLVALTGVLWWATRPKGRDAFWDVNTKPAGGPGA